MRLILYQLVSDVFCVGASHRLLIVAFPTFVIGRRRLLLRITPGGNVICAGIGGLGGGYVRSKYESEVLSRVTENSYREIEKPIRRVARRRVPVYRKYSPILARGATRLLLRTICLDSYQAADFIRVLEHRPGYVP